MNASGNVLDEKSTLRVEVSNVISTHMRLLNLTVVILTFLGFVAVVFLLWGRGVNLIDLSLLLGMYVLTAVGITVGYHRLLLTEPLKQIRWSSLCWPSLAQWPSRARWVAVHRRHHQHSDTH